MCARSQVVDEEKMRQGHWLGFVVFPSVTIIGRPLQATVRPMLRDRCPVPVRSFCNIGVLWPNGWMDQDATWYEGR